METWQLLVGLTAMLVLYVAVATALGRQLGPIDVIVGVIFGGAGLYAGEWLSDRLRSRGE